MVCDADYAALEDFFDKSRSSLADASHGNKVIIEKIHEIANEIIDKL